MIHLPSVTLISVDTTPKAHLAQRAMHIASEVIKFGETKLITNDPSLDHAVIIPRLDGLEGYSNFIIKELWKHVDTSHALIVQYDGYPLNPQAWDNSWLQYDYIGAPFNPSGVVGNGGFSLRSKRLLDRFRSHNGSAHPEDAFLCIQNREMLAECGMRFAPKEVASKFAVEGRSWNSVEWQGTDSKWNGQFGFHSFLTTIPPAFGPHVFHATGDYGDLIYGLSVMKALKGGVLFLSMDNRFPYPTTTRAVRNGSFDAAWVDNIKPLLMEQDYVWGVNYTHGLPYSTTVDLNRFRLPWKHRSAKDTASIYSLHHDAFGTRWPEQRPWMTVAHPVTTKYPIVVNRTQRYHDNAFPWDRLVQKYGDQMLFVGSELEAQLFQGFAVPKKIAYQPTANMLELARVIAGARVFLGNQSAPLAIAHGLGKTVVTECWKDNSNCCLKRDNAFYSSTEPDIIGRVGKLIE